MKIIAQTGWYLRRADVPLPALTFGVLGVKGIFVRALIPLLLKGSPDTQNASVSHLSARVNILTWWLISNTLMPRELNDSKLSSLGELISIFISTISSWIFRLHCARERYDLWRMCLTIKAHRSRVLKFFNCACHRTIVKIRLQDLKILYTSQGYLRI